ncbi:MAG TPA: peptide chain release factor-like protein, partial [Spirochaetota bacterium]|nr:peptide chain release factor-like protein [Spirochaetota bacterium]
KDLVEQFVRAGGKGGQKVNKTSSCVILKHPASGCVVKCSRERSREVNRFLARRRLVEKLSMTDEKDKKKKKIRKNKKKRLKRAKAKYHQ